MSFFSSNPFATKVGQLIEQATDSTQPDENIELIYEIVDVIESKEENAKDAIKAIRKKFSIYGGRNWSVIMKTLNLLDVCSTNCKRKFQIQLSQKDFLQDLKNLIGTKLQPPLVVQEKVLYLIQKWSNMFKDDVEFKLIESYYNELRTKGIDFPVVDETKDSIGFNKEGKSLNQAQLSPTRRHTTINHTSASSTAIKPTMLRSDENSSSGSSSGTLNSQNSSPNRQISAAIGGIEAITLTAEQMAKINSELDVVECNLSVFNEILNQQTKITNTNECNKSDIDLLRELNRTCKDMQSRIVQLVGSIANENVIGELLRINDDLINTFLRYERFERSLPASLQLSPQAATPPPSIASTSTTLPHHPKAQIPLNKSLSLDQTSRATVKPPTKPLEQDKPLINFDDDAEKETLNNLYSLTIKDKKSPKKVNELHLDEASNENAFLNDENEIKEMENWLSTQGVNIEVENKNNEFDQFLDERTKLSSSQQQQQPPPPLPPMPNRNIKNDDKSMFAL